jgi:sugar O-acyltransferase (sialic acid O-acetyltransferase NeuD family)
MAEILAARHGIDIAAIAERVDRSVTERDVEEYHASRPGSRRSPLPTDVRDHLDDLYPHNRVQRLLVIGAGRGAVQILDVLTRDPRQRAVGLLDENPAMTGKTVMGCPVLGSTSDAHRLWEEELFDAAVISISTSIEARVRIFDACTAAGIRFANVVDPSALVLSNATLGAGNVILELCHIGAATTIGDNNFMSARTHLEHHNTVASHNTFGPCVVTSSRVEIGSRSRLGTGIFVEPGILIGDDSVVASGAVLTRNVPPATVVKVKTTTELRSTTGD